MRAERWSRWWNLKAAIPPSAVEARVKAAITSGVVNMDLDMLLGPLILE
jgi:hypothetical protein